MDSGGRMGRQTVAQVDWRRNEFEPKFEFMHMVRAIVRQNGEIPCRWKWLILNVLHFSWIDGEKGYGIWRLQHDHRRSLTGFMLDDLEGSIRLVE